LLEITAYHDGQRGSKHGDQRRHAHGANKPLPNRMVEEGEACMRNEREHADDKHQEPRDLQLLRGFDNMCRQNIANFSCQIEEGKHSLLV
jgi:hypothetical protein